MANIVFVKLIVGYLLLSGMSPHYYKDKLLLLSFSSLSALHSAVYAFFRAIKITKVKKDYYNGLQCNKMCCIVNSLDAVNFWPDQKYTCQLVI